MPAACAGFWCPPGGTAEAPPPGARATAPWVPSAWCTSLPPAPGTRMHRGVSCYCWVGHEGHWGAPSDPVCPLVQARVAPERKVLPPQERSAGAAAMSAWLGRARPGLEALPGWGPRPADGAPPRQGNWGHAPGSPRSAGVPPPPPIWGKHARRNPWAPPTPRRDSTCVH